MKPDNLKYLLTAAVVLVAGFLTYSGRLTSNEFIALITGSLLHSPLSLFAAAGQGPDPG